MDTFQATDAEEVAPQATDPKATNTQAAYAQSVDDHAVGACEKDLSRGCPNSYVSEKVYHFTGEVVRLRLPCKTKGCPVCGPWLRQCHFAHATRCLEEKPGLHFLTLVLKPSYFEGGPPWRSWTPLLSRVWDLLFKRLRRRFELEYFWTFEWPPEKLPHRHCVLSACPRPKRPEEAFLPVLEKQFRECGEGTSLWVDPLQAQADLEGCVGYMYKNTFTDSEKNGRRLGVTRVSGASEGLGYTSEKQVRRRRRIARQQAEDPFVMPEEASTVYQSALRRSIGETVLLPDGRTGRLLEWSPSRAEVEVRHEGVEREVAVIDGHKPLPVEKELPPVAEITAEQDSLEEAPFDMSPSGSENLVGNGSLGEEAKRARSEERQQELQNWTSKAHELDFAVRSPASQGDAPSK